jgi:hypothetical protein
MFSGSNREIKRGSLTRLIISIVILFCTASFVQAGNAAGNAGECKRETLQTAVDSYLAAQKKGDLSKALLADRVKYIENLTEVKKDKGIWNTPLAVDFDRSFLDVDACRTFTEVIAAKGDNPYVIGTRLTVEGGRISEIDSMVTKKDDWLFNAVD